jgi:hypothetical protein
MDVSCLCRSALSSDDQEKLLKGRFLDVEARIRGLHSLLDPENPNYHGYQVQNTKSDSANQYMSLEILTNLAEPVSICCAQYFMNER